MKKIIVEISKEEAMKTSINQALKNGFYNIWDSDRIKRAFNAGHGTLKDLERYRRDNKNYIIIKIYTIEALTAIIPDFTI